MMRLRFPSSLVWLLVLCISTSWSFAAELRAGIYEVEARILMPNLEEHLRYAVTHERHCLNERMLVTVFPVLRHVSLTGCHLINPQRSGPISRFQLVCQDPMAASGAAWVERVAHDRLTGVLDVQMGGKNMTFSQRIQAVWRERCP